MVAAAGSVAITRAVICSDADTDSHGQSRDVETTRRCSPARSQDAQRSAHIVTNPATAPAAATHARTTTY
jgi:hypothetical protein